MPFMLSSYEETLMPPTYQEPQLKSDNKKYDKSLFQTKYLL